jgi:hypothetical protein
MRNGRGSEVKTIAQGISTARKHHQCFECYRNIAPNQKYGFQTNIFDGRVYTLKWHLDCAACGSEYRISSYYDDDGFPPLRDEWIESGEYKQICNNYHKLFPHVVARMELTDQLREARK